MHNMQRVYHSSALQRSGNTGKQVFLSETGREAHQPEVRP